MKLLVLFFPVLLNAQVFPQTLSCVSVINSKIHQKQVKLNEFAMAQIEYSMEDWMYTADVIENRLNSVMLTHTQSNFKASVYSIDSQVQHLHIRLDAANNYATVDCELKF